MAIFEWQIETKLGFRPLVALYRLLFKPKGYKELTTHSIYLSQHDGLLYYRAGDITGWAINPQIVSHLVVPEESNKQYHFSGYAAELHTLDNDKHGFQCDLSQAEFKKMEKSLKMLSHSI